MPQALRPWRAERNAEVRSVVHHGEGVFCAGATCSG
jgi:enoyl-CoA hydratase/carnithine racemase